MSDSMLAMFGLCIGALAFTSAVWAAYDEVRRARKKGPK